MKKSNKKALTILIILAVILFIVIIYFAHFNINNSPQAKRLAPVEIREYNGSRLDSVNDFRENSIKGVQYINISNYSLIIDGLVSNPKNYSYDEVISHKNYEKVVTLNCVEGWSATILWKGVLVKDLLDEAKPLDNAKVVIFHAYDGYTVTYPVTYFNKDIIMAYEMNNATVIPARGFPFVLVAEDKWGYKWIKWITEIELSNDTSYKGYWESRGYSKEGNLNESFYS